MEPQAPASTYHSEESCGAEAASSSLQHAAGRASKPDMDQQNRQTQKSLEWPNSALACFIYQGSWTTCSDWMRADLRLTNHNMIIKSNQNRLRGFLSSNQNMGGHDRDGTVAKVVRPGQGSQSCSLPFYRRRKGSSAATGWRLEPATPWLASLRLVVVMETALHQLGVVER